MNDILCGYYYIIHCRRWVCTLLSKQINGIRSVRQRSSHSTCRRMASSKPSDTQPKILKSPQQYTSCVINSNNCDRITKFENNTLSTCTTVHCYTNCELFKSFLQDIATRKNERQH
ncbi:hypothetical protein Tcan_00510, partial [Toxocara canis]